MAEIKKINTELQPIDKLLDTSGDAGTSGQVLSTTGSGTNWIDNDQGSVTGTGATNRVAFWSDTTVLSSDYLFKWDDSNNRLSIGAESPVSSSTLTLNGNQSALAFSRNTGTDPTWTFSSDATKMYLSDDGNSTYNMTWQNNGAVGIGTTAPTYKLEVKAGGDDGFRVMNSSNGMVGRIFADGSLDGILGLATSAGAETVLIRADGSNSYISTGNFGLGTTSPQELLDVNTVWTGLNVDNTAAIFGNDVGTTQSRDTWIIMRASTQTNDRTWAYGPTQSGDFKFNYLGTRATAPTSGSTFLNLGNTGLATFAGTVLIDGVANYTGLEVKGSGASRPAINFTNVTQGNLGRIYGTEGNALVLASGSGNATTLTLDSSNNATFAGILDVNGTGSNTFAGRIVIDGSNGSNGITLLRPSDSAEMTAISAPDSSTLKIGGGNQSYVKIFAHTTEVVEFNNSGNATFAGNILIGNTVVNPASGFSDQTGIGLKYSTTVPQLEVSSDAIAVELGRTSTGGEGQILALRKAGTVIHSFSTNAISIGTDATFTERIILSQAAGSHNATPTIAFGDGDSGFYERFDDDIRVSIAGTGTWEFAANSFGGVNGGNAIFNNETATTTNPTVLPYRNDSDTGIGGDGSNTLSLIAGGVEALSLASTTATFAGALSGITTLSSTYAAIQSNINSSGTGGLTVHGNRLGFDQSGTRSWTMYAGSGNLNINSGDGNGILAIQMKATSATTITGDGTQTLTTKNYVDGLIVGATIYQGTWDARTSAEGGSGAGGSPDLTTSTYKTNGYYLVVSNEGTATPNGPSTTPALWHVGDWVIYNDHTGSGAWQKIDNSSVLSGTGTGQKVIKWAGSGTSDTIADGPITFSTNDSTFAGAGTFGGILKVSYSNPAFDLQESGTSRFRLELGASHTYLSALGAYNMYFRTNSGAALTIYADQDAEFHNKVGIGITPAEMLDIQSASGDARIRLDAPASSDTEIKFYNAGVAQYTIGHDDATDNFVIGGANVDAPLVSIAKDGDATFTGNISVPAGSKVLFDGSSGHTYIEEESDTNLKFYVAAGERLNLTNSYATFTVPVRTGSITTPTNTSLFLIPNGSGHVYLGDSGNGTNLYHYSTADDGKYTTYDFNGDYYRIATTATSGIKIDDTLTVTGVSTLANVGYLGDGLGSVQYTLQSSNTGYGTIDFGDVADSNIGRLEYNHNDNSFLIRTNNTTALTLDSSQDATFAGNILGSATDFKIGANTSDASDNAQLKIMGGGDATDTRGASIHLAGNEHANAGLLQIRAGDGATGGIRFYEGGSERMRITAGNVGIGIAAPNFRLGLSNSATSTAVYQQFTNGTTGVASGDGTVMGIDADGDFLINNQEAKEIKFYTSDAGPRLTIQADGDAVFAKDVLIPRYLYHDGDSNTYLDFQTDRITLVAGSIEFVDCSESTQNVLTLGASSDMDVNMRGGDGYVFIQGSNGYIGINDITPSYPLDINANTYITGTLKTTGPITINNWLQQGSGSLQKRTYSFTTADPGGQFFLGKIEDSDTDGAIDGTITFAYDYGSTNDQCKLHFNFVQRDGAARGTWWYEGDDQDIAADRVHVQLIDDGSGGMFVWVIAVDYSKCIVDTSWMDGNSVVDSGVLSDGTPTTGTVLFDTADDPTAEMHVGTLFAHGNVEASGTIACPAYFNATGTSAVLGATGSGQVLLRPNGIGSSSGQLKIATSGDATFASGATFGGDVTINGTLTEEGSGSNKTYTWRTPSSTSWSGGVKNVKFGRIYWCPNHWTNGAVINIILQGSYYAGVERKYTVTAQYLDTDPIIQQLSVADTDNKIALKVGATTSAGYDYSGQPVYYADLNFVCNSYMVGWCIVKSQMPFLTANPTSTWGGIVMDATLTEPDTSATFPDSYNTTFAGDVTAQGGTFTQAGGGVQILNNGTAGYNANLFFGKSGGTDGYSIGQGVTANDGVFRIYNNGTASVALAIDNSDNATFAGLLYGPDGSKAAPTYSFTSDTNTGMHSDAADQLSLIAGGNTTLEITGSTIALNATTTLTSANLILSTNANIELETSIGSGKSSGTIIKIGSGTLVAGKCYAMYNNAGPAWSETDPTDENFSKQLLGIALGSGASAATTEGMLTNGIFYDAAHSFTVGEPLFLSTTTGTLSNTAPTTSGDLVRVVGYAIDTDEIYFCPDNTWVILD